MQNLSTPADRRAELNARLDDLIVCAASRAPGSSAERAARTLAGSLRDSGCTDTAEHASTMRLLESCIAQLQAGKTALDLKVPQPTVEAARRHLERTLPR